MTDYPSFDLTGKVALVTGAGKGLGRACALALAHAGADVALGLRDKDSAADLESEIKAMGRKAVRFQMDVGEMDQIKTAFKEVVSEFGTLDILVNNVGVAPANAAEDVTEEDYDLTLNLNVKGTFFCAQEAAKIMIPKKSGKIINMSSQAGFVALDTEAIYCMTKAAVNHLTKCLAVEWAEFGIHVNAVAPTFMYTPGTKPWLDDKEFHDSVVSRIPLGKIGQPKDVAGAVVFLASPAAAMITGEVMLIDGGWTSQ